MVPGIGVEFVCLSGAVLAKAGTVLDVCLVGGKAVGMCEFLFSSSFLISGIISVVGVLGFWGAVRALF